MKFLVMLLLVACSTVEQKPTVVAIKPTVNAEEFKTKCDKFRDAMACARYGYLLKDINYTQRACELGHQDSCFNLEQIRRRSVSQNQATISANQGQIFGCYVNHSIDTKSEGQKNLDIIFDIDPNGKLTNLSVDGRRLSDKFKNCVYDSFASKKFASSESGQRLTYGLVLPEQDGKKHKGTGELFESIE